MIQADLASNWKSIDDIFKMMDKCKELGIAFAKLQLFNKEQVSKKYWKYNILTEDMAKEAFDYGTKLGLVVYFTPCYPEAVDICERIGVAVYKIRYKDRNNKDIYEKLKDINKPIFVSTQDPEDTLYYGMWNVVFLYVVHKYPATREDYDMTKALEFIGISDHTPTPEMYQMWGCNFEFWEMHVCLEKDTLEKDWSKVLDDELF